MKTKTTRLLDQFPFGIIRIDSEYGLGGFWMRSAPLVPEQADQGTTRRDENRDQPGITSRSGWSTAMVGGLGRGTVTMTGFATAKMRFVGLGWFTRSPALPSSARLGACTPPRAWDRPCGEPRTAPSSPRDGCDHGPRRNPSASHCVHARSSFRLF